jgi:molecular chaperone GrpE (heat shock protein)
MECTQLLAQEVKAQEKYRSMNTEKIADLVLDVLDNSDKAVTSASQSGLDANEAKQELRDIQQAIHSKKCK